jgi:DNA topoisomerase-2
MKELEQQGYDKENGNVDDEEDNVKGYNYLLRMPIRTFSDEKIEELNSNIVKIQSEIDKLTKTTEKQMWLSDLDELEKEYTTWLDDITKSQQKMKKKSCKEEISRKKKKKI